MKSPWLVHGARRTHAALRLFCFPYAGAGASAFRHWAGSLPRAIDVIAIQPPGREGRIQEVLATDIRQMARSVADALVQHLDIPYATFGHSLGTLLSYETVLELRRRSLPTPLHMFFSGRSAPHVETKRKNYHLMPRDLFVEELRKLAGTPNEVLESEALMEILLPMLRADFALSENYQVREEPKLSCKVTVFGGLDDVETKEKELRAWQSYTNGAFAHRMFEGGHFFVNSARAQVIQSVARELGMIYS